MGDGGQQLHALLQVRSDTILHGIERTRRVGDFAGAVFIQACGMGIGVEGFHGAGQAGQGADRHFHRQPGAAQQQAQLQDQYDGQPERQRHAGRAHVDGHRAAIAQVQVRLEMRAQVGHFGEGHGMIGTDGVFDRACGDGSIAYINGLAGLALGEQIAVVTVFEAWQPGSAFGGGQAVENGDGDGHIALQVAQHGGRGALVAFVELRAEGEGMGQQ
ncbi:hypothetical protein D9M71_396760 [compost metagenome]